MVLLAAGCRGGELTSTGVPKIEPAAKNLLLVTIDTLRADHVGTYGNRAVQTPAMDSLAARGAVFQRAYATAPITLTSHASIMTGRYPVGHGARHNGIRLDLQTPTLADRLSASGFATAAFVAAFPLDRRFGLIKGFQTYADQLPRAADGRPANERPGRLVVDEALAWLNRQSGQRLFLWVHLFEPHAPYGNAGDGRPVEARYSDEVAEADRQLARLLGGLGDKAPSTLVVVTSDHGEAFGEHGEISHSIFVYDTTLRVPLIVAGPGVRAGTRVKQPVSVIDIASTASNLLGAGTFNSDGLDLSAALAGTEPHPRTLYAESFAPLFDFGWSPLKSVRDGDWNVHRRAEARAVSSRVGRKREVRIVIRPNARARPVWQSRRAGMPVRRLRSQSERIRKPRPACRRSATLVAAQQAVRRGRIRKTSAHSRRVLRR